MTHQIPQLARVLVAIAASVLSLTLLAEDEATEKADQREQDLKRATAQIQKCEMRLAEDAAQTIERVDHALLRFADSARANTNGTLWAYGKSGRPLAFIELYQGDQANANWCYAATLTSTRRIVLKTPMGASWQPDTIQIEPAPIAGSFQPDPKEGVRSRQLKELARRFTAHEFWDPDNSRFELRLLEKPIHRYSDPAAKI